MTRRRLRRGAALLLLLLLAGCAPAGESVPTCTVVFEDDPELFFYRQVYEVRRGSDLTVSVGVPAGRRVSGVSYERYTVSGKTGFSQSYDYYTLILHDVRYPAVVRLTTAPCYTASYLPGEGEGEPLSVLEDGPHLRANTLPWRGQFSKRGCVPIGWNTAPDGSGERFCFGARYDGAGADVTFYPQFLPASPEGEFSYAVEDGEAVVTGWSGAGGTLAVPESLGGLPVTAIAAGAFGDVTLDTLVLPPTLRRIAPGAFRSLTVGELCFFDSLEEVDDSSFGALSVTTLRLNAVKDPVYSVSYFATFPDKMDYLRQSAGEDKLVLLCGSAARFGYDSPLIEAAFPGLRVVNMGVVAYANLLPQARMVLHCMKPGDLLLSSPELDAIGAQFCGERELGQDAFCLTEGDCGLLSLLDCREFTGIFDAYAAYQRDRAWLAPRSYKDTPSQYDEDGVRVEGPSYNVCGDYILYRENNAAGHCFGIKRASYDPNAIRPQDWDGLNALYRSFTDKGVQVYFTFSPRMRTSVTPESTPEAVAALDAAVREKLTVPVISHAEESLMDPLWFYGTDNHLSTEGVRIFTEKTIRELAAAREGTP